MVAVFYTKLSFLAFVPQGYCYSWKPELMGLQGFSDGWIAFACFLVAVALVYFVSQQRNFLYHRFCYLFAAWLLTCGLVHGIEIVSLWHPLYWISGGLKSMMAGVSLVTAATAIPVIPKLLHLVTPGEGGLETPSDASDRKQTETQLQDLTDRLRLAVESAKMGIWDWDIVNNRMTWDDWIYRFYELSPEVEATYSIWESLMHPDDLAHCRATTQQALIDQDEGSIEFRIQLPGGNLRYIQSYFLVQRGSNGQPLRMIGANLDISDRKTAETDRQKAEEARLQAEKLRLELNLLERILDGVLAGYWDADLTNNSNYWSPGLKRMFGYEDHELPNVPETWQSLIFAEDLPATLACFDRHVQSRGAVPYYNEVRYRHKDGSTVWVICAGEVIDWDANGQPLRIVGCHVDITKLKQAEAQLQKSDVHLKLAQRIGKIGSWEFDLATEEISWSDQVFCIFGRDPASGTPNYPEELQQLFHPDDRALHQQAVETAIKMVQPYDIECRAYRADGTPIYIQAKGEPLVNAAGQVTHLTGTILDFSERKQAENALRQSEATNRALISAIPDLLIWIHQDGTYLDALGSGTSVKLLKTIQEQIGANIYDLLPYHQAQKRMEYVQKALKTNEVQVYEYQFEVGEEIRDEEARIVVCGEHQVLCMVRDITSRKQAETQLLQTTAQLEASNRELEAFAYSVSHDLRAPLRAIDGFSKALLEDYGDQFDAEGQDYFDRIRHNVQRMGMLIDDLLSLSRVSRYEMQRRTVNLSRLVQEQATELQASAPDRQVEFTIAPNAIVSADLTLMRVVINNLLENAWKFTSHHSSACIEFGIIKQKGRLVYFVRDDGAGFDMTYADKLFGVFQRLHNTHEFPGTGIGLATVQRAIHRHGGQVWAKSFVEQGATIYFTIPEPSVRVRA